MQPHEIEYLAELIVGYLEGRDVAAGRSQAQTDDARAVYNALKQQLRDERAASLGDPGREIPERD